MFHDRFTVFEHCELKKKQTPNLSTFTHEMNKFFFLYKLFNNNYEPHFHSHYFYN